MKGNLLKPAAAAKMLQISTRSLSRYTSSGLIARVKIGKSSRYQISDIEEFINYSRQKPFARKEVDMLK